MDITQTHLVAHIAQRKFFIEASRPDQSLRLLVGHANLLNSLATELSKPKQTDYSAGRSRVTEEAKHIQMAGAEPEADYPSTLCYRERRFKVS